MVVGSFEAKTRFSALIEQAENGEEIVITRRGKPVAKIVAITSDACDDNKPSVWEAISSVRGGILGFTAKEATKFRVEGRR